MKMKALIGCNLVFFLGIFFAHAQTDSRNSGGMLIPEQAAYDVTYYELTLNVNPKDSSIRGNLILHADVLAPLNELVVDLDMKMRVGMVREINEGKVDTLKSKHEDGKLKISFLERKQFGESFSVRIDYGGKPLAAQIIPGSWSDGFHWTQTENGDPWIGVVSVLNGADT